MLRAIAAVLEAWVTAARGRGAYMRELQLLVLPVLLVHSDGAENGPGAVKSQSLRSSPQETRYDPQPTAFKVLRICAGGKRQRERWIMGKGASWVMRRDGGLTWEWDIKA